MQNSKLNVGNSRFRPVRGQWSVGMWRVYKSFLLSELGWPSPCSSVVSSRPDNYPRHLPARPLRPYIVINVSFPDCLDHKLMPLGVHQKFLFWVNSPAVFPRCSPYSLFTVRKPRRNLTVVIVKTVVPFNRLWPKTMIYHGQSWTTMADHEIPC